MESKLQRQAPQKAQAHKPNLTGIPTQIKLDFERRSGLSFDDVRVHYNSDKPARLQALAYTQGTQVYVGPGQEKHLPHELGHVIQQKAFPIHATSLVNGVAANDNPTLETQADILAHSARIKYIQAKCASGSLKNAVQRARLVRRTTTRRAPGSKRKGPAPAKTTPPVIADLKRPNFSAHIRREIPVNRSGFDRRHIIPFLHLRDTLLQIIKTESLRGTDEDTMAAAINSTCNKWPKTNPIIRKCGTLQQEANRLIRILFNNEHNLILDTSSQNQTLGRTMEHILSRYLSKTEPEKRAAYDSLFSSPTSQALSFSEVFQQIIVHTKEPLLVDEHTIKFINEKNEVETKSDTFLNHVWGSQKYDRYDYERWLFNISELYLNVAVDIMNKSFSSNAEETNRKKLEFILGGGNGINGNFFYRLSDAATLQDYLKVVTDFLEGPL